MPIEPRSDIPDVDVDALARRVVSHLRAAPDLRADLIQQANVLGLDLLQRFQPRTDSDSLSPLEQAERYLYVSLTWQLRGYARTLRSSLPVPERDRRLARDYQALLTKNGPQTLAEAALQLKVKPRRLAIALAATDAVISLDRDDDGGERAGDSLAQRVRARELGPEELVVGAIDDEKALERTELLRQAISDGEQARPTGRRRQTRRVLYLFLDRLPDVDAEIIRLSFALPRKEQGSLRSCRTYGCRQSASHQHPPSDIARWVESETDRVIVRLAGAIDELGELLGGRDPRRLLLDVSAAT